MLSIGEIERIARLLYKQNSRLSAWPLLLLIEISKTDGWQKLNDVVNQVYLNKGDGQQFLFKPLVDNNLIQMQKVTSPTSQFAHWQVKLSDDLHRINDDSFDIPVINRLAHVCKTYMTSCSRTSNLLIIVVIAIAVRKLSTTHEVFMFCQAKHRAESKIINQLAELGFVQLVKTDDYKKSTVAIFEVE